MTRSTTSIVKIATVAAGLAMFASLSLAAAPAYAQSVTFNVDLTIGSTGADVTALQTWLISKGYSIPAGATGYFGTQTQAAVAAYQAAVGITPAVGYFGPITRAKVNAGGSMSGSYPAGCTSNSGYSTTTGMSCAGSSSLPAGCTSTAGYSPTTGVKCSGGTTPAPSTGGLEGTDGSISDVNELSSYNNEDVAEGDNDVKILGMEVEASNDGDIELRSVKISFDPSGNTGSDNLDDYIDSVTVWMGDEEIGSADVSDFDESSSNIFTKTVSLNGAVIRADETENFYVTVNAVNNIDSGDISGDSWTVDVENIRFIDGSGVTTTETGFDLDGMDVPFDFVTFSTAANTELKITTDSDSPEAGIVVIDDVDTTDDVVLLKGNLELEGTSDVVIDTFPVTFTGVGSAVATTTGSVKLTIGGEEYTETMSIAVGAFTGTVTFDNLDFAIDAGDTVAFTVSADINDIDTTAGLDEGDTLLASVTSSNRDVMDVENSEGDQLSDSTEKSGTAIGEAQEFRTNGIMLTLVSTNTSVAAGNSTSDDLGTFKIKFKITAIGDAVYVSTLADATLAGVTTGKTSVNVDRAGTATVGGTSVTITNVTDTRLESTGTFKIEEGASETFEVVTTVQLPAAGAAGQFRVALAGVMWDTDSTDATPDQSYTSNLDSFKTEYIGLN